MFAHSTKTTMRMQDTKNRAPSSLVLQEMIRQAPAEYVTVDWLTSRLQRHSFGIIMLCLGLLATTPVGSSVPRICPRPLGGAIDFWSHGTCFPAFHHDTTLADYAAYAAWLPRYSCFEVSWESSSSTLAYDIEVAKRGVGVVVLLMVLILLLTPMPLSNVAPAIVISMISLAYVEEDGLLLSAAFLAAIILLGIASAAVWGAIVGAIIIAG
jgi:hypothetical protein